MDLVIGATGKVRRHLVDDLLASGASVRALSRHPEAAGLPGAEVVSASGDLFPLQGVDGVFVNLTALGAFREGSDAGFGLSALLAQSRAAGVRRIVLLSSASVFDQANPVGVRHRAYEAQVERSSLTWTHLRPGIFAASALAWAGGVRAEGVVRAPFADAHLAPIHERDVAAVAARALHADDLAGRALELTGPEVLTPPDQARIVGGAIGQVLRFEELPPEALRQAILAGGEPAWAADGLVRYHERAVTHHVRTTSTVNDVLGRPALTFADWTADHAAAFLPAAQES